ncbi:hypothetical protein M9H77_11415 [Catharanthus roseus]|uniref:Uncharacterized protein n=1 Tax=Catharanthus roseus TaxID=4058 RepID=A0ACC0BEJ2_CATRO|nr:hypothetical protein M9H77_11415 [Catharanthus roseus]
MVRSSGRRGDDDLGTVADRTGRVEGRTVIASSRGLRGQHSTSDILSTPTPFATGMYYATGAPGSSAQPPHIPIRFRPPLLSHCPHTPVPYDIYGSSHPPSQPPPALYDPYVHASFVRPHIPYRCIVQEPMNEFSGLGRKLGAEFWDQMVDAVPIDSSVHGDNDDDDNDVDVDVDDDDDDDDGVEAGGEEGHVPVAPASLSGRSHNKGPDKERDVPAPTQKKKAKSSDWELTGLADSGRIDPELIPLYGGHVAGCIFRDRGTLHLTGWTLGDPEQLSDVATDPHGRLSSSDRAACYLQYLLGSSLFTNKNDNVVTAKLWPLVKNVRSCRGFA